MNNVSRLIINDPNTHRQSSIRERLPSSRTLSAVDVSRLENNQLGVNHSLANH